MCVGDGSWYRAMVQSVEGDGKARVYFVDYGNSCEVQVAHLRPIDSSLLKHPFQAIRCCLAGMYFERVYVFRCVMYVQATANTTYHAQSAGSDGNLSAEWLQYMMIAVV